MTRTEPPPGSGASGMSAARISWYFGGVIFFAAGRFSHSCAISKVPPRSQKAVEWNSLWTMPRPAVIHCTSPGPITPPAPVESACSTSPWKAMVMVSKPRWGCSPTPGRRRLCGKSSGCA